jgi:hypothetical protein
VKGLNDTFYFYLYQGCEYVPFSHILLYDSFRYVSYAQLIPTLTLWGVGVGGSNFMIGVFDILRTVHRDIFV